MTATALDVDTIEREWLDPCGYCDAGDEQAPCTCPTFDPKSVIADLIEEIHRLRGDS